MFRKTFLGFIILGLILLPCSYDFSKLAEARADYSEININSDTTWSNATGPLLFLNTVVIIAKGKTLTLLPGTILKLASSSIVAYGTLRAQGTVEAPVVITSINDNSFGGDSNGPSNQKAVAGDWGDITVSSGELYLDYAKIMYGGLIDARMAKSNFLNYAYADIIYTSVVSLYSSKAEIINSELSKNMQGLNSNNSSLAMHNSRIFNNKYLGLSAVSDDSTSVDVINNWWGDNSGPYNFDSNETGKGNAVIGNALFDPWIGKGEAPSNLAPTISYANEDGYALDQASPGIEPNKGGANSTDFSFKAVYTDQDNDAPQNIFVVIDGQGAPYAMTLDASTSQANLIDGDYRNGEQYILKNKFPQGKHFYHFVVSDGQQETRLPEFGELSFEAGYSNVAFIPGLQASRLYAPGLIFENQLWEPNRSADVEKLFLDQTGNSVRSDVYTRDVIDSIHGFAGNIYKTFIESLNKLVTDKTINNNFVMPYDWRLGLDTITNDPIKTTDGSYRMITEIEKLARESQTGKVTIVAHSMGGLVAKRLMMRLKDLGEENLVDLLILVAVPQAGTPKACLGLLHGDDQELMGGWLLSKATARAFGENMKGAYSLLPSASYFAKAEGPVIEFGDSDLFSHWRARYGSSINSAYNLNNFILGSDGRADPSVSDTDTPNVLSTSLLSETNNLHNAIDNWTAPEDVRVVQVAGWGLDTVKGIKYTSRPELKCPNGDYDNLNNCNYISVLDREPISSKNGDNTVIMSSAVYMEEAEIYYLNLNRYNKQYFVNREHKDIFEVESMRNLINELLIRDTGDLPLYITKNKDDLKLANSEINISVHSPVSLDLYDSTGRHTGKIKNTDHNSDLEMMEENIPNSYYYSVGEGKYAGMSGGEESIVSLTGQGYGTFTLDISEIRADNTETTATYKDVPVTPNTKINMAITSLASRGDLQVDLDGDGTVDISLGKTSDSLEPHTYIVMIEKFMDEIKMEKSFRKNLVNSFETIEKLLAKNKDKATDRANRKLAKIQLKITKNNLKDLPKKIPDKQEALALYKMINSLINLIE